jgi:hypothetical protein
MDIPAPSVIARFERMVSPEPNSGCWLWLGACAPTGRGNFTYGLRPNRILVNAPRFAFTIWRGSIPDGLQVLHRCDVPNCVNPDHLFLGTAADNIHDMIRKGRNRYVGRPLENALKTHCRHGHPLSGSNLRIRADGARICKACRARLARNWRKTQ